MRKFRTTAVLLGLAAYAAAFLFSPLPSICDRAGEPLLRGQLLGLLLLLPNELLTPNWFGSPPEFCVFDRLPVFFAASAIVAWATLLGWLAMAAWQRWADEGTVSIFAATKTGLPPSKHDGRSSARTSRLNRLEMGVFSTAIGLNLASTWVLLLGLFGVMGRFWVFGLPTFLTILAAVWMWHKKAGPGPVPGDSSPLRAAGPEVLSVRWLWLPVPFALMMLLAAAAPPLDFDVREYHLQAPKEFFQQGQITFLPHNVYANMAMGAEMLSLLAMIVVGDWWLGALAGKVVIAVYTLLTALTLLAAGWRFYSQSAGVVALLVFISIPWVVSIASGGFVEGGSACYLLLAVYAILLDVGQGRAGGRAYLALAGFMAGAAVATKYPAVLFVLAPMCGWVVGFEIWRGRSTAGNPTSLQPASRPTTSWSEGKRVGRVVAVFLLAAAVGCGAWFAKNWVLAGNPTYPLLYQVFGGETWTLEKDRQWNAVHRPHDFSPGTLARDVGRVVLTSEWLSPLVVPLAALAFLGMGRRWRARWVLLAYVSFVVGAWWLLTHRIDRFWIPVLPVVALLAGVGACWCDRPWWRWTLAVVLAMGLAGNFLVASSGPGNAWFVSLAKLRGAADRVSPWHRYFNLNRPEGRLLLVGDAAPFDLDVPVLYNTCFDDCIFEQIVKGRSMAEVRRELAQRQITDVCVNWGEIDRYRKTYGFTEFVRPEIFARLVSEGVLEPLPPVEGGSGEAYRVR